MIVRFPLKTQFIAGFVIIFCGAGIFSTFVLTKMGTLSELNADMYRHPYTVSNAVRDVNIGIISLHRHMKDVALAETNAQMETAIQLVNSDEERIFTQMETIRERFLGGTQLIDEATQSIRDWVVIRNEVIRLMRNKEKQKAAAITKGKGAMHVQLIEKRMRALLNFANIKAIEFSNKSKQTAKSILNTTLFLLILLFLTGLAIAYLMYRSISTQLTALINAARAIGKGDYLTPMPDLGKNELGELAEEFDRMRISVLNSTTEILAARDSAEKADLAKSRFLSNMSHELRTPMHAILSFANLSLKRVEDSKTKRYIGNISSSGTRLLGLLDDLLDLAKLETGNLIPNFVDQDLTSLVHDCINQIESLCLDKGLSIEFETAKSQTCAYDGKLMGQVITNILANAVRYPPIHGLYRYRTNPRTIWICGAYCIGGESSLWLYHRDHDVNGGPC